MLGLRWSFSFVVVGLCNWPKDLVQQQRLAILAVVVNHRSRSKLRLITHKDNLHISQAFVPQNRSRTTVPYKADRDGSARAWSEALTSQLLISRSVQVEQLHVWGCVFWNRRTVRREMQYATGNDWKWPRSEVPVSFALLAHRARFLESINPELLVQGDWD